MSRPGKREHFGACMVRVAYPSRTVTHAWPYPTMEGAVEQLDPFNSRAYWPLRMVMPHIGSYLKGMGL